MPKVSVIIPVYNTAPFLEEAIKSIFSQTLKDIEIIAINDGSTDKSLEILKRLQLIDSRLIVYSQDNKGQSVARNKGIELATGEYIYFFDSDDILSEDCLSNCYNISSAYNCDFVCFDADVFYNGITENKKYNSAYQKKGLLQPESIYKGNTAWNILRKNKKASVSICLNFIRSNYITSNKLSFYPGIIHEDRLFTFLLYLYASRIKYIAANYFHRRMRINSTMTTQFSMKNVNGLLTVCHELSKCKKKVFDKNTKNLIDKEIKDIVNTTASSSIHLPFKKRICILKRLCEKYSYYLSIISIIIMLCPILKLRK